MSDGGKGSAPRKQRDDDAFRSNWDKIFGQKKKEQDESESDKPTRNNDNH